MCKKWTPFHVEYTLSVSVVLRPTVFHPILTFLLIVKNFVLARRKLEVVIESNHLNRNYKSRYFSLLLWIKHPVDIPVFDWCMFGSVEENTLRTVVVITLSLRCMRPFEPQKLCTWFWDRAITFTWTTTFTVRGSSYDRKMMLLPDTKQQHD